MSKTNTQMRDIGRKRWLLNSFRDYQCQCGEAELVCLEWYPHHKKIRSLVMRHGAKTEQRKQAIELIEKSTPLCHNCAARYRNDLGLGIL